MDQEPPKKKSRLSLNRSRFKEPTSSTDMHEISKGYVPENTAKSTAWGVKVFQDWRAERNVKDRSENCPPDLLETADPMKLNFWLSRFVTEIRKQNGQPYPPRSIQLILAALQRKMLETSPDAPWFLDQSVTMFREIHRTCNTVYRGLHKAGVGAVVRHTAVFTVEEENKLWENDILSIKSPKALQRAVFFYVGKLFCVRGGDEQRRLGPSQFVRLTNPDRYNYTEHGSKNRSGGLAQLHVENKSVPCYSLPDMVPQCLVFLLDLYLSKLPPFSFKDDILYCRPKFKIPADDHSAWYDPVAVGKNSLGSFVKDMCKEAGLPLKTNHSLRTTGATVMFQSHVPEKIIQNTTGHRSLDGLRKYEHISAEQHHAVSRVMMSSTPTTYEEQRQATEEKNVCNVEISKTQSQATGSDVRRLFGDLTNCSIGNITINIGAHSQSD